LFHRIAGGALFLLSWSNAFDSQFPRFVSGHSVVLETALAINRCLEKDSGAKLEMLWRRPNNIFIPGRLGRKRFMLVWFNGRLIQVDIHPRQG